MEKKIASAILTALALAGCAGGGKPQSASQTHGATASITIAGSTALLPLVKQAAMEYQATHPNITIVVSGGGSMTGIAQAAQKAVDIGDSDVPAVNQPQLVDHRVAIVPFTVVVNPSSGVRNLTTSQIRGIFSGKIINWSMVGGANQRIVVIHRPRSSGTRAVFVQKILGGAQPLESGMTQDSSGTVAAMVAQTPGAISYLAVGYVQTGRQTAVSINGVEPSNANVITNTYPYWSYEHMLTNGRPPSATAAFIDYVQHDTKLLRQVHFLPVTGAER